MRWMLVLMALITAGCTESRSYYFDGELVEKRPGGETVNIPVLLERQILPSEDRIVINNHQITNGAPRHFATIYDFKGGAVEMRENGAVLSAGNFTCERAGGGLETLTACTYTLKTTAGDTIHGTDSYDGTHKVSFDTVAKFGKEQAQYVYSGEARTVSKDAFKSLLSSRFKAGASGCAIDPAPAPRAGSVLIAVALLAGLRAAGRRAARSAPPR